MGRVGGVGASALVQFVSASRAARTRDRGLSGTLTLSTSRTLSDSERYQKRKKPKENEQIKIFVGHFFDNQLQWNDFRKVHIKSEE